MRKEVLIAIIAGIALGLVVALGIWRANSAIKNDGTFTETSDRSDSQNLTSVSFDLTISDPEEGDVETSSPVTVTGITTPGIWVALSGEEEDYTLLSNEKGEFSQEVELTGGINQIVVTAFSDSGESLERTVNVVYTTSLDEN